MFFCYKVYANAINDYYAEKYGSLEQAADSFAEQPVSVALDALAMGMAGGDRIDYKSMVQNAQKETSVKPANKEFASEAVDALYPAEEINRVKKAAHKIYTEHDTRIFPELKDGVEYRVVTLAQAKNLKLPNVRDDIPVQSIVKDNVSHIVWQEGKISNEFKNFYKNYEGILGELYIVTT